MLFHLSYSYALSFAKPLISVFSTIFPFPSLRLHEAMQQNANTGGTERISSDTIKKGTPQVKIRAS